jgi:hypothetical protein
MRGWLEGTLTRSTSTDFIRVKFLSRGAAHILSRQLPGQDFIWGNCLYLFDPDEREYDWLVVYNDLPYRRGESGKVREETLACPLGHTLLVTTEPSCIKTYGSDYAAQFAYVITSQEPWALPHPGRIYSQPGLHWFYGVGDRHVLSYDNLLAMPPPLKTSDVSMVWSEKRGRFSLHTRRHEFMRKIRDALPELGLYGRGVRDLDDKAEALDAFRYHITIENHIGLHHWTEKLADPFLAYSLPFYYGCPNVVDYFPAQSLIPIDITDYNSAVETIVSAIDGREYEKRLPFIKEARRRVLEQYNLFAVLEREIVRRHEACEAGSDTILYSRHALASRHPFVAIKQLFEKARTRLRCLIV